MPSKSKRKGNSFEYEIVHKARESGLEARRAYASDGRSFGENKEVDVMIGEFRIQAKRRRSLANYLQIPPGVDSVVFRQDRGETYALVKFEDLLRWIRKEA